MVRYADAGGIGTNDDPAIAMGCALCGTEDRALKIGTELPSAPPYGIAGVYPLL